jgi:phospholipid/cholesterol/gamma-HCH transport system substrate-binding protein
MENKVNYATVGAFVVALLIALLLIGLWLSTGFAKKQRVTYAVYMHESVSGLNIDAPVKYNGVNVGSVRNISLNLKNTQQVRLLLEIDQDIPITEDTQAMLTSQGLTGVSYIDLKSGAPNAPLLEARAGEEYPVIKTVPSLFTRLDITVQQLSVSITNLSNNLATMFDQQNQRAFKDTMANLDKITTAVAANSQQLSTVLQNTAAATKTLPATLQILSNQVLPQTIETLNHFQLLSTRLQSLTGELQSDPSMLVRGRAPLPPGPGE